MKTAALYGILLLAHGGAPQWNDEVEKIRKTVDGQAPAEAALGMADDEAIQSAIDKLQARGVQRIIAVPLFVNSSSEVLDQTRYLLGLRRQPSEALKNALAGLPPEAHAKMMQGGHHHMFSTNRVKTSVPISMARAFDDHQILAGILTARAKALSKAAAKETVVLVGHGPVDEKANDVWLATLRRLADKIRSAGNFRAVKAATLRDDSPESVKETAAAGLRALVTEAGKDGGRALVVPVLIAKGGIEDHVVVALTGLDYAWDGATICPDAKVADWVLSSAAKAARDSYKRK